jgi:transglutaminase-like putative cysteine protease
MRYWRGPVLSAFDGETWTPLAPRNGELAPANEAPVVTYTVSLEPNGHPWLFALDVPASIPVADDDKPPTPDAPPIARITREQQLLMRASVAQPIRYVQRSQLRSEFPLGSPREVDYNRVLPPGNPQTVRLAQQLREAHPDDIGYARAVLRYFRDEPFVYTLEPPLYSHDRVDDFLFGARRGFCEHYASAFVTLMRAAGIPSRVVTGYQGGEINPRGDYLIVRQSDAHAWAEVIIDGRWQRFDPTAAVSPLRIERGIGAALPSGELVPLMARLDAGWIKNAQLAWDAINHQWRRNVVDFDFHRQRALWRDLKLDRYEPWHIATGLAALAAIWALAILAWLTLKRRRQERALVLWEEVCRRLGRAGLARHSHEGPLAYAERAATRWPQFAIAFRAIGESFARLRYDDTTQKPREREAMLATLQRAIEVLPGAGALRDAR